MSRSVVLNVSDASPLTSSLQSILITSVSDKRSLPALKSASKKDNSRPVFYANKAGRANRNMTLAILTSPLFAASSTARALWSNTCALCSLHFRGISELRKHLRETHDKDFWWVFFWRLSSRFTVLTLFAQWGLFERKESIFERAKIVLFERHQKTRQSRNPTRSNVRAFTCQIPVLQTPYKKRSIPKGGHPSCRFCHCHFFGPDELYAHMEKVHITCPICQPESQNYNYYKDDKELVLTVLRARIPWNLTRSAFVRSNTCNWNIIFVSNLNAELLVQPLKLKWSCGLTRYTLHRLLFDPFAENANHFPAARTWRATHSQAKARIEQAGCSAIVPGQTASTCFLVVPSLNLRCWHLGGVGQRDTCTSQTTWPPTYSSQS